MDPVVSAIKKIANGTHDGFIGSGSFRSVYKINNDLVVKKDHDYTRNHNGSNKCELKHFKNITKSRSVIFKNLFLPLLGTKRINNRLYLIFPYVKVLKGYGDELSQLQESMANDIYSNCRDARECNMGKLKNTTLVIDYGLFIKPDGNYKTKKTQKNLKCFKEVEAYCNSLKQKYKLKV